MATTRSRTGDSAASERRHVALTMPRQVKDAMLASAQALEWSAGDWVLAAAAEHGRRLCDALRDQQPRRRIPLEDATSAALYVTPDEREELDELARACGLNRSAFVTAVSRLAVGDDLPEVLGPLRS